MKKLLLVLLTLTFLGCSSDDSETNGNGSSANVMTITLKRLNYDRATIEWTRPSNASAGTVLYEIVLNNQVIRENFQNTEYEFFGLQPETNYNVIVSALDTEGKETFDQISFTTLEDNRPPPITYNGNLNLNTQAQVDNFSFKNITGFLSIRGVGITDLSPLSTLEHVSAGIRISETSLQNLNGLENLDSYDVGNPWGGSLYLGQNNQLIDISGMNTYLSIGRKLELDRNPLLSNITGVTLNSNWERIVLRESQVTNLDFLSDVTSITEELWFYDLQDLTDASGLSNMIFSGENYQLQQIPQLGNLVGDFESVLPESRIVLMDMPLLNNIDFLSNITELRKIRLDGLSSLNDLSGVNNLQKLLDLHLNALPISNLDDFSTLTDSPNNWHISFYVTNNPNLTDFCGVRIFMANTEIRDDPWGGTPLYSVYNNAYNPLESQIESPTECSQ
ncbi:hypothetical protein J1N09_05720 [Aureitalea sp. L0-47]|uniref:fibronectin type III domain-containing protein n=1 Tax=Aureitalea sp. L0-47 TaxID=2816962 RepID=UPI0022372F85|nr:fibronectin type III domain-containing protein [Aureitalea sp. L0-47]MCW5519327.1 hypothetical protein [Aureitalea sp. L0-47]